MALRLPTRPLAHADHLSPPQDHFIVLLPYMTFAPKVKRGRNNGVKERGNIPPDHEKNWFYLGEKKAGNRWGRLFAHAAWLPQSHPSKYPPIPQIAHLGKFPGAKTQPASQCSAPRNLFSLEKKRQRQLLLQPPCQETMVASVPLVLSRAKR